MAGHLDQCIGFEFGAVTSRLASYWIRSGHQIFLKNKSQIPSHVKLKKNAAGKQRKFMLWLLLYVIIAVIDKSLRNKKEAMEVYNALTFTGKENCHNCQTFNKYVNFPTLAIMRSLLLSDILLSKLHYLSFPAQHTIKHSQWATFLNVIKKIWHLRPDSKVVWAPEMLIEGKPQKLQSFSSALLFTLISMK